MMLRLSLSTVLVLSVVFSLTPTAPVFAYEITTDPDTGNEVYQPNSCFYYSINDQGSDTIFLEDLLPIVRKSFDAWEDVTCSFFFFEATDLTSVNRAEFNQDKGNVNLLVWRNTPEEWHTDARHTEKTIALTTVVYDTSTGETLDADIEFNGAYFAFGSAETAGDSHIIDLQTVITHEIGHTIGLDDLYDSAHSDSTMYGVDIHQSDGSPSTDKRQLDQDDIDGLCLIYPINEDPDVCKEPVCGLDLDDTSTSCKSSGSNGCQVTSTGLRQSTSLISRLLELL